MTANGLAQALVGLLAAGLGLAVTGCGGGLLGGGDYGWLGGNEDRGAQPSVRSVRLMWDQQLTPEYEGAFVPVELSSAALDPGHDRIYIGSTTGELWAMTGNGGRVYAYDAAGSITAPPALDPQHDELFLPTENGVMHLLRASTGEVLWRAEISGAVSRQPVLTEDAIYLVTDNDVVEALNRESGEPLWRYRREAPEGYYISRHAGLTMVEGRLLTGFTAGVVVSLDPSDGSLQWERDTSVELEPSEQGAPRFADVDTTPIVIEDKVYIASFAGGMYGLELESGTVLWRDEELTGVTSIARASDRLLVLSSGELGLVCIDKNDRTILWRKTVPRGAPANAVVARGLVMFGETQGGFVTAALQDGRELGRLEAGHGFSATPSIADGRGFILSNGGTLYAFRLPGGSS